MKKVLPMLGFYIDGNGNGDGNYEKENTFLTPYVFGSKLPALPQLSQRFMISRLVILLSVEEAEGCLSQLAGVYCREWSQKNDIKKCASLYRIFSLRF
jgi:hypothetical protein